MATAHTSCSLSWLEPFFTLWTRFPSGSSHYLYISPREDSDWLLESCFHPLNQSHCFQRDGVLWSAGPLDMSTTVTRSRVYLLLGKDLWERGLEKQKYKLSQSTVKWKGKITFPLRSLRYCYQSQSRPTSPFMWCFGPSCQHSISLLYHVFMGFQTLPDWHRVPELPVEVWHTEAFVQQAKRAKRHE